MEPGQVIIPHNADEPQQPGVGAPPEPSRPASEPDDNPQPAAPQPGLAPDPAASPAPSPYQAAVPPAAVPVTEPAPAPVQVVEPAPEASWQYQPAAVPSQLLPAPSDDGLTWTASEFIAHEKGFQWYGLLLMGGVTAAAADYLLLKDKVSTAIILLVAVLFAVASARKPRTQQYVMTHQGLQIGARQYFFQDYKNFSVTDEGASSSVVLMPLRRFMPPLTIYLSPDIQDQAMDFLGAILPFEQHRADAVDALMRRIRF